MIFREMSSFRLSRYSNSLRSVHLRRAKKLSITEEKKKAIGIETTTAAEGHVNTNTSSVYDGGLYSSYCTKEVLMKSEKKEYHVRQLGRLCWHMRRKGRLPESMTFRIRSYYPFDYGYDLKFTVYFKKHGVLIIQKEFIFKADVKWQDFIFKFDELDGSFYMLSWYEMQLDVIGKITVLGVTDIWNDVGTERDFRKEECPHDRVLVIKNCRFYVLAKYLAMWSRFFNRLFFVSDVFMNQKEIVINDVDVEEFCDLLSIIYPDRSIKIYSKNVEYLLELADRFEMPGLLDMCEKYLSNFNNHKFLNIVERIEIANKFNLQGLLRVCCDSLMSQGSSAVIEKHKSKLRDVLKPNFVKKFMEISLSSKLSVVQSNDKEEW